MPRDTLFISHANPEDNEFTRWLALRLAGEGYRVWCDLTKLLGGEVFWSDIEVAIRSRTAKFIYVLSRTSNEKNGPLSELQVAQNVARDEKLDDFVIPVAIDSLPPRQATIALSRINSVFFKDSWASGLAQLLKKLEKDGVPKDPAFNAAAVATWWRAQYATDAGVREVPEDYISSRVAITELPATVYIHDLRGRERPASPADVVTTDLFPEGTFTALPAAEDMFVFPDLWALRFPCARTGSRLVSFADARDLFTGDEDYLVQTVSLPTADYLENGAAAFDIDSKNATHHVTDILRVAWDRLAKERGLFRYKMATRHGAMFFPLSATRHGKIDYVDVDGKRTYRKVVGEKKRPKRYWHFAISTRPLLEPAPMYSLRLHVTFSDDGYKIWDSASKLHSARRSQCKNWWNDQWRDRMLATLQHLASGQSTIVIPVSSQQNVRADAAPLRFTSPVSFADPNTEEFIEGGSSDEEES